MAYEKIIPPEQYDNVLKRVFTKGYTNPELSEIKDFLDKIIEEEIPGLELDPKTASPSKYQDINNCIHTFKYVFPNQKKK